MKICVLGAGVIGVSTAYALARSGHEVIVIDKGVGVASGASQANGAQLSYSYVDPFSGPATLKKIPFYLGGFDPAIRLGFSLSPHYLKWGLQFLRNCSSAKLAKNLQSQWELAQQSYEAFTLFESELPDDALKRTGSGKIVLASSLNELHKLHALAAHKSEMGFPSVVLNKDQCIDREPALIHWRDKTSGGILTKNDHALDPVKYCEVFKSAAETQFSTKYMFDTSVEKIIHTDDKVAGIQTDKGTYDCDSIIVCLGNAGNEILRPLGISLPIYPMQGYSVTLPATDKSPKVSITDPKKKIVFANLGDKIRIAGFMDANQKPKKMQQRGHQLIEVARQVWPRVADYDAKVETWTHYRPMTPSGVPVIGQVGVEGLYVNLGHGSFGYTLAAGSAMQIAEKIGLVRSNYVPAIKGQKYA